MKISLYVYATLFIPIILASCSGDQVNEKDTSYGVREIRLRNIDSVYSLDENISVAIKAGTFKENTTVFMKYILADNDSSLVLNNLSTITKGGENLKTVGMVRVDFFDKKGQSIKPLKPYEILLTKDIESREIETIKLFHGIEIDNTIFWEEEPSSSVCVSNFSSNVRIAGKEFSLRLNPELTSLTNHLDQKFDEMPKGTRFNLVFGKSTNNQYQLDTITWESKRNIELEDKLIKHLTGLSLVDADLTNIPVDYLDNDISYKYSISGGCADLFSNSVLYETKKTGWFNFDIYINSPIARLKTLNVPKGSEVRLVSLSNDRSIPPSLVKDGVALFSFPIEDYSQRFKIYLNINQKLVDKGVVEVKQEKETVKRL